VVVLLVQRLTLITARITCRLSTSAIRWDSSIISLSLSFSSSLAILAAFLVTTFHGFLDAHAF
jgi:hypothetical protein